MGAGLGSPGALPFAPGPGADGGQELGVGPGGAVVGAEFDAGDGGGAGPGASGDQDFAGVHQAAAGHKVGYAGGNHQGTDADVGDGVAGVVGAVGVAVGAFHLVAVEVSGDGVNAVEPFDAGHTVPAGDDQAQGVAVLGRDGFVVHCPGQQDVVGDLGYGEAALVPLALVALHAFVQAGEYEFGGVRVEAGFVQQGAEGSAGPAGSADGFVEPGLAQGAGGEEGAAVAGAFQGDGSGHGGAGHQVGQG